MPKKKQPRKATKSRATATRPAVRPKSGHELSVQYHNRKDETIYLLWGEIVYRVQREGDDILDDVQLQLGESFRITPGTIHQMIAVTDCDVLEVSTPEVDDIVRLSDKYGREGTTEP